MRITKRPILCNYYVTYRCNAKCDFCDIWEKPSPYVDLRSVERNFIDLKKLGVKVIDFTGGEPLLHQEIDKILMLAKKYGFVTTLTTNALLYPKWADRIKGLVDMLHFSLDASTADLHDEMRGVKCFDFVMKSIAKAKSLGEKPDVLFTAFPANLSELTKVYDEISRPNNLVLIINPEFSYGEVNNEGSLNDKQLDFLSFFGKKKDVYLNGGFIQLRRDGGNHVNDPICKAASTTLVISPENKLVVPCYHLGEKEFEINDGLYDLYLSKEVEDIKSKEGKLKECEGCVINCYMQPSFAVNVNKYWWSALSSTLKYNRLKGTWKALF